MPGLNRKERRVKEALEKLVANASANNTLDKISQQKLNQLDALTKLEKELEKAEEKRKKDAEVKAAEKELETQQSA